MSLIFLGVNNDKILIAGSLLQDIDLLDIIDVDLAHQNILDVKTQRFLMMVFILLRELLLHFVKLRYFRHNLFDVYGFLNLVEVHILQLALNHEHTLVVLEIEIVFCLECHKLADFNSAAHVLYKFLLLSDGCFLHVMVLPDLEN